MDDVHVDHPGGKSLAKIPQGIIFCTYGLTLVIYNHVHSGHNLV